MDTNTSCPICLDDYKGKKTVKIQCQYCEAHACRGCHQRYLLSSFEDPQCMTCKRGWSTEFIGASFGVTFRGTTLRMHRRKVLFEREKTMLPALQVYVEYKREIAYTQKAMDELSAEIGNEYSRLPENMGKLAARWRTAGEDQNRLLRRIAIELQEIERIKTLMKEDDVKIHPELVANFQIRLNEARKTRDALKESYKEAKDRKEEIGILYREKKDILQGLRNRFWTAHQRYEDTANRPPAERREFIMKCPADDCRGFLSTAYKCGTCEARTCKECMVCLGKDGGAEHICVPGEVESAKAIRAETRPCPKCGTRIFKIDGCDQMWCVMEGCGTAFSWISGHIVTGVVHNPHYYEWLRRQRGGAAPREAGDIPCGGMPTTSQFVRLLHPLEIPTELKTIVSETFRNMQELINARLPDYPAHMPQLMNRDIDVDYLMKELTEDEWKRKLEMAETVFNRKKEIGQILQTLATAGSDMMNRLYEKMREVDADVEVDTFVGWLLDVAMPELDQLRAFGNDSLKGLAKRDRMAVPQLGGMWTWTRTRALYKTVKEKVPATAIVADATTIVS